MKIIGYSDRFSVKPGEEIGFLISSDVAEYTADIVRLIHGDTHPDGPGFKVAEVTTPVTGRYPGRVQTVHSGSHIRVEDAPRLRLDAAFTIQVLVNPTRLAAGRQALVAKWDAVHSAGYGLYLAEDGSFAVTVGDGTGRTQTVRSSAQVLEGIWYLVAAMYDGSELTLLQRPMVGTANGRFTLTSSMGPLTSTVSVPATVHPASSNGVPLTMAAHVERLTEELIGVVPGALFNGKLDRPRLHSTALSGAEVVEAIESPHGPISWPRGISRRRSPARESCGPGGSPTCPARGSTAPPSICPTRAMTGYNWRGARRTASTRPSEYGAIHFHDDDLDDAALGRRLRVRRARRTSRAASTRPSCDGGRATRTTCRSSCVRRAAPHGARSRCSCRPATYLAYANEQLAVDAAGAELLVGRIADACEARPCSCTSTGSFGGSIYDVHTRRLAASATRRGCGRSLNVRPEVPRTGSSASLWQFNADLHLIDWLDAQGIDFDVITDEDLQREGVELLEPLQASSLTGSHPEYYSRQMLDAIAGLPGPRRPLHVPGRQRLLLGDHRSTPTTAATSIEVRRSEAGIRAWTADPGEYHHAVQRRAGRVVALPRAARRSARRRRVRRREGFDLSSVLPAHAGQFDDPRVSWIFEGIGYDERLGDFGLVGGGAAGTELDIVDTTLGTPPHTLLVATSAGRHTDGYLLVMEDFGFNQAGLTGTEHPRVRADIALPRDTQRWRRFAFSSIAYCGSLSHNNYDNNISRLTKNVLDRFAADADAPLGAGAEPHPLSGVAPSVNARRSDTGRLPHRGRVPGPVWDLPLLGSGCRRRAGRRRSMRCAARDAFPPGAIQWRRWLCGQRRGVGFTRDMPVFAPPARAKATASRGRPAGPWPSPPPRW